MKKQEILSYCLDQFQTHFPHSAPARVFFAPGRVNLIGEHTDYNDGLVFPAALTMGTYMVVSKRNDHTFKLVSANFEKKVQFTIDELSFDEKDDWGNFPKGVIKELRQLGVEVTGANIFYYGNLPNGAGLSSSASIGMVSGFGLSRIFHDETSVKELALLSQRVENHFIGVNSGIMDQYAVGFGKENHAIYLNCGNYEHELVPLELGEYKIVITNTNKKRELADSKYNERRGECEEGVKILQDHNINIKTLSDLSAEQLSEVIHLLEEPVNRRVRHVVTENQRVISAKDALKQGELLEFGQLMKESHISLRDDYEVTGKELDSLYDIQSQTDGCIGTRMTGAGFGGCTVSIVHEDKIQAFCNTVSEKYKTQIGLDAVFYVSDIGDGVKECSVNENEK